MPWPFSSLQIINVDWVHVENRASEIAKSDKGVQLVLGQLIDEWVLNDTTLMLESDNIRA